MTLVVASAASSEELGPLLKIANVDGCFDHVVRPDEVDASKPDADVVRGALRWKDTPPQRAVMIGDTRYDIEAAHRAHVRCIAVRCGGSSDGELAAADAILDAPLDLVRALHGADIDELVGNRSTAVRDREEDATSAKRMQLGKKKTQLDR